MERPKCETCPYWVGDPEEPMGECRIHYPEIPSGSPSYLVEGLGYWPETSRKAGCGDHPDFPAYLASLKKPELPPIFCEHCHGDGSLHAGNSLVDGFVKCPACSEGGAA